MKRLTYILVILFTIVAASCTEPTVDPKNNGGDDEDEPITIGQPPKP